MSLEPHALLNFLQPSAAGEALARCCGSRRWVESMLAARPYPSTPALLELADRVWSGLGEPDVLEAFSHHPQIGANLEELQRKFAATASWSASEQSGAASASADTLLELRTLNLEYLKRFGFIFIVCASGKTAAEMLLLLRARLPNPRSQELRIAAGEQAKITRLRLERLGA